MNTLITGGAGFIGANASKYFYKKGHKITILDNFSREGSRKNIEWLKKEIKNLRIIDADVRSPKDVKKAVEGQDFVLHLAGQVAVTSSVLSPREDFESNLLGTFNLLEAARTQKRKPIVFYSSTNKVYGGLENLKVKELKTRFAFAALANGVSEEVNLDFHSPYGCSKGSADQYVRDYYRIYNVPTVVFRQSCIYGPRQFGIEDQGWLAWFIIALSQKKDITIYGTGKQVRDVLYVDDLLDCYYQALVNLDKAKGEAFNIGGGPKNAISVWYDFRPILETLFQRKIEVKFEKARPGDQPIYISDIRKAKKLLDWSPRVSFKKGIPLLYRWVATNSSLFTKR